MHYVGHRASEAQPLRSMPLYRTVGSVFGATRQEAVEAELRIARGAIAGAEASYAAACAALGKANRMPLRWRNTGQVGCRALHQAEAMRVINARRRMLRAARRRVLAAELAVAGLTPADAYVTPYLAQIAAERAAMTQPLAA